MLAGDRLFLHRVGSSAEVFPVPIEFIRQAPQLSNGLRVAISAGLILRQAILAGLAKRILILTPKSVHENLELPPFPELPLVLRDLDRSINLERARPPEIEWRPLDAGSYSIGLPGGAPIRVTTDAQVFDFSADGHQLFSPGGDVFDSFCVEPAPEAAGGRGIAWLLRRTGGGLEFVVATRFGPRRVETFAELLAALDVVGVPTELPLADWPGVTASVIA